ncbi:MAG: FHA domain-containing protein [Myxococcaceae bacterium]
MPAGLLTYARQLVGGGIGLSELEVPVLVWASAAVPTGDDPFLTTQAGNFMNRPRAGEPMVFELKKGNAKQNAFVVGISVGRADSNDVPLDDVSVSRFHAYFQKDLKGVWRLHDAESSNGTWLGALKLKGKGGEVVADKSRIRFGDVETTFYEPKSFIALLQGELSP